MASFQSLYNDIEYRLKQTQLRLKEFKKSNRQLVDENAKLTDENDQLKAQVAELNDRIKLMTITQTLIKKEDKTETKRKITELVREIDNCISILNS